MTNRLSQTNYGVERPYPVEGSYENYRLYPFKEMEVGDHFFVPIREDENDAITRHKKQVNILAACRRDRYPNCKFTTCLMDNGIRVLRIQ